MNNCSPSWVIKEDTVPQGNLSYIFSKCAYKIPVNLLFSIFNLPPLEVNPRRPTPTPNCTSTWDFLLKKCSSSMENNHGANSFQQWAKPLLLLVSKLDGLRLWGFATKINYKYIKIFLWFGTWVAFHWCITEIKDRKDLLVVLIHFAWIAQNLSLWDTLHCLLEESFKFPRWWSYHQFFSGNH